jgi:NADPH:quinone reductase-like Zn-dependent oxidoreductase
MASSSLPATMRGVIMEKDGGIEVLQYRTDLPLPTLQPGEVLIKNEFAGVNYIDTCASLLPPPSNPSQ